MPRKDPNRSERGPKLHESVCIGEDVKIGIHLAIQRFRLDPDSQELSFPSSFSTTERAYVHRYCCQLGSLKTWSRGNGQNRYITVRKVEGGRNSRTLPSLFSLAHSAAQLNTLLNKYPVTVKEKQDLTVITDRGSNLNDNRERSNFGRLSHNVPQVPPKRSPSELNKFRETLPIYKMGSSIIESINNNQVVLVAGETGSGKTTQVPQLILDDYCERQLPCRILCTQPRRIAALSVSERVALERGERLGHTVGYQIRLDSKISPKTILTFCTTGVLLRTFMGGDACLSTVTHILVDEVHERDRFTDFLLLCLKEALPHHPNLHLILMSATLNLDLFSGYFNNCPVVCVAGNLFQVTEYFLEDILKWTGHVNKLIDKDVTKKQKFKKQEEQLTEWCSKQLTLSDTTPGSGTEDDSDVTTSDNAELGEEKEDLDPWIVEEMDKLLREAWQTGNEELFNQILHLISNENVSVDYVQTETSITPLMIAAARGFINVVEHLLTLGADANLRTTNNWTAIDFARKFNRIDIEELLKAHCSSLAFDLEKTDEEDVQLTSEEDRELLSVYQHNFDDEKVDIELVNNLIFKIHSAEGEGAILVFLPGFDEIVCLKTAITEDRRFEHSRFVINLLHSSLQQSEQKKVFKNPPSGVRKIILSTNIAETSITIDDVVFVIDCGKVKEKTFDALTSFTSLKSNWISKASALQRKGRAGRCQPGKCYHLFSRPRYMHLHDFQTPEILRLPLQELCLQCKLLAPLNESVIDFLQKCPQAPPQLVIHNAVQILKQIDAFDPFEDLTELGQHLADLPIEPRLGKMILYSVVLKCLDPVLTIVCTLSFKEPFIIPALPSEKRSVMGKRRRFAEETYSDHMVFLRSFQAWQKAKSEGWERAFCEKNYISSATMEMLLGMRMQLLAQLRASGFLRARGAGDIRDLNTNSDNWALVKACLLAGTYPNLMQRDASMALCTLNERNIRFHSSSVLQPFTSATNINTSKSLKKFVRSLPSKWIIYDEMSRFQRVSLAKYCSLVSPTAVFLFGGPSKITTDAIVQQQQEFDEDEMSNSNKIAPNVTVKLDDWIGFDFESELEAKLAIQFRMKWHSLFLNRMKHPSKAWSLAEEAVLQTINAVLTNAEKAIGLENPIGVGQRPRTVESLMGTGFEDYYNRPPGNGGASGGGGYSFQQHFPQHQQHPYQHQQQQQHHSHQQHQHYQAQQQHFYRNNNNIRSYNHLQQRNYQGYNKPVPVNTMSRESSSSTPLDSPQSGSPSSSVSATGTTATANNSSGVEEGRYFLMRCNNQKIVDVSETKGIWATSVSNETKLNRAFNSGKPVYLIFSVPGNANFQGYAKMTSLISKNRSPDFPGSGLTGTFSVSWVKRATIPFSNTNFLNNPWNENRRVHTGRDGQEIEPKIGLELIKLWDTIQARRPQSSSKKKTNGPPATPGKKQPSQKSGQKEKSYKCETPSEECGKERSDMSHSSPSPSSSTNTNHSSNSSTTSPAFGQKSDKTSGAYSSGVAGSQFQGHQNYSNTGGKGYFPHQPGAYVQPVVGLPAGLNSVLLSQQSGHSHGNSSGQSQQQQHYFHGTE
ncbi:ATP-dependent RNA helicase YTHDC2 [Biomphalaria glabrata]|nr:ATP-dependent RNA helicase YTHDC2 [Biomphalaria glabrata]